MSELLNAQGIDKLIEFMRAYEGGRYRDFVEECADELLVLRKAVEDARKAMLNPDSMRRIIECTAWLKTYSENE